VKRMIWTPVLGVIGCLAFAVPAHADAAAPTSTLPRGSGAATPTTVVQVADDADDDDSDKTGLWGLLGLLGLAGLAGLKRRNEPNSISASRPVTGTAPPGRAGAPGTR